MKQLTSNYSSSRKSKRNDHRHSHLKLLWGWVGYFILYFLTENFIPAQNCTPVHIWLDDWIPFCEYFLIPYVFWYFLIVMSLGYFLRHDVECFRQLQTYITITQVVAMAVYILFPNRQDLRPTEFLRENFLTMCVRILYRFDTNTGVCPSLHVAYSIGIASVWLRKRDAHLWWKIFVVLSVILICLSTLFVKQHSALDFLAALPVCALAEILVFGRKSILNRKNKTAG